MPRYATGKYAKAISDRSGLEYRYKDMRKEWNGALVGKDEFERKHPQLGPFRKIHDPQTLKEARPNNNKIPVTVKFPATVVLEAAPAAIVTSTSPLAFVSPSNFNPVVTVPSYSAT